MSVGKDVLPSRFLSADIIPHYVIKSASGENQCGAGIYRRVRDRYSDCHRAGSEIALPVGVVLPQRRKEGRTKGSASGAPTCKPLPQ